MANAQKRDEEKEKEMADMKKRLEQMEQLMAERNKTTEASARPSETQANSPKPVLLSSSTTNKGQQEKFSANQSGARKARTLVMEG